MFIFRKHNHVVVKSNYIYTCIQFVVRHFHLYQYEIESKQADRIDFTLKEGGSFKQKVH